MVPLEKNIHRVTIALKSLAACQILSGAAAVPVFLFFKGQGALGVVGEEIMMDGRAIELVAFLLMFLVAATGIVSLFRLPWGWVLSFSVASLVLVMALLMGPGTIPVTKWSFLGLMVLSLVNWAAAVVYYFHDLYT